MCSTTPTTIPRTKAGMKLRGISKRDRVLRARIGLTMEHGRRAANGTWEESSKQTYIGGRLIDRPLFWKHWSCIALWHGHVMLCLNASVLTFIV